MHAAQLNFLSAPEGLEPEALFERWPSLADIPEAAAGAGARVTMIQAASRSARLRRHGIDYRFVDVRGLDAAARGRRYAALLAEIDAEVVHAHSLGFAAQAWQVARHAPALPLIVQDHADRPPRRWRRPWWRRWYGAAAGFAFTAAELAAPFAEARLFGPHQRLFEIPESSCRFQPGDRAAARAATGLHGDPCVVWVGHLSAGKDPLAVLDGVALAAERLPGLQLWCAFGSAPWGEAVRERIGGDPRLAGRVHLLGRVAHAQVELLMRAADLYVSGSHAESCGYALLEALACGAVPVVTDIPSYRSLTGDGRIGRLWPRGDAAALAEALVDMAARRPSAQAVRAHFELELSFAAVGRKWAAAYAQLLDERGRR